MFQLISMLIVVWICINSLWYQTFILVVLNFPAYGDIKAYQKNARDEKTP